MYLNKGNNVFLALSSAQQCAAFRTDIKAESISLIKAYLAENIKN